MRIAQLAGEYAFSFDSGAARRLLVIPALLDEANKLRRFTLDLMRALAEAGIDSALPDLPGCNESLNLLPSQTLASWREAMRTAADEFGASGVLTIRGGTLIDPGVLPALAFAPVAGASLLRAMLRAAVISGREAGHEATREGLMAQGLREGLVLGGYALGAAMLAELEAAAPFQDARVITQAEVGGSALWLRAEPGEDIAQAVRLAALVAG